MSDCVIIEDDPLSALDIKIKAIEIGLNVVKVFDDYTKVQSQLTNLKVDIILSDVKLGLGIDAPDILHKIKDLPPIIFFSNSVDDKLYEKCQTLNPYIYLTKPVNKLTLRSSVEGALKLRNKTLNRKGDIHRDAGLVFIRDRGKLISVDCSKVSYVFAEGNYCTIHIGGKKIAIRSSLRNVIEKFNNENFIQIHRSYLINLTFLEKVIIGRNIVELRDISLPIGRKFKKNILEIL